MLGMRKKSERKPPPTKRTLHLNSNTINSFVTFLKTRKIKAKDAKKRLKPGMKLRNVLEATNIKQSITHRSC